MAESLRHALRHGPIVVDGAIGTELMRRGLAVGTCPESWNRDHPLAVRDVHRAYLEAGCRVVTTNSFGGHPSRLALHDEAADTALLNAAAAQLARAEAGPDHFVIGSLGPCGEILAPLGSGDPDAILAGFALQSRALLDGGADLLLAETMSALDEMRLAVRAARGSGAAVVGASFAFDRIRSGDARTMMGVDPATAARAARDAGADLVGANCGSGFAPAELSAVVAELARHSGLPVLVEPNAGAPDPDSGDHTVSPAEFAAAIPALVAAGASFVGSCCGSTPAHTAAIVAAVRA